MAAVTGSAEPAPPSVAVVIPTRNRLDFLRESVASVQAQSLERWELVVVDDASDDGTFAWLEGLDDRRVRAVRQTERSERSAARNRGLAEVQARYVVFLDDDDLLAPRALEALVDALAAHPDGVVAAGTKVVFDEAGNRKTWRHPRRTVVRDPFDDVLFGWIVSPGECAFRVDALRAVGGWRAGLSHGEDQELWLRLASEGPAVVIPPVVLEYRRHGAQARIENAEALEDETRAPFLAATAGRRRSRSARTMRARAVYKVAAADWHAGRWRACAAGCIHTLAIKPGLLVGPLAGQHVRAMTWRALAAALVPRRLADWLSRLVWRLRSRRGNAIRVVDWVDDQTAETSASTGTSSPPIHPPR